MRSRSTELLGFNDNASVQTVSPALAKQYVDAAKALATEAVMDVPRSMGCDPMHTGEDARARRVVTAFLPRAFRRPVTSAEIDRWSAFHAAQKMRFGFVAGVERRAGRGTPHAVEAARRLPTCLDGRTSRSG